MITGRTGEKIVKTGTYFCQRHHATVMLLIEGDSFPHCPIDYHIAVWELKENPKNKTADDTQKLDEELKEATETTENTESKTKETKKEYSYAALNWDVTFEKIYKHRGFFAAMHYADNPDDYSLKSVLHVEHRISEEEIGFIKQQYTDRLAVIKQEFDSFKKQLEEKELIKGEFKSVLEKMEIEYVAIREEIRLYYIQLRDEIKSLGLSKENLISKRIDEFEKEINKIIEVYHNVENAQNDKFRKDHAAKNIQEKDKAFYYNFRQDLEVSFRDIQNRLSILRREGLSYSISKFLISIGWIAAFVSSWFFVSWYSGSNSNNASGILVYILDNLRNFTLEYGWKVSLVAFLCYMGAITIIARLCYMGLKKLGVIKKKDDKNKKNTEDSDDNIELNLDKEIKFKSQFKASSVYEMWLKILPYVAMILLLVIILALGSQYVLKNASTDEGNYQALSNSLSLQVIGFLLPIASTALGFLYIIKIIEAPTDRTQKPKARWEISLVVVFFFVLIALFIASNFFAPLSDVKTISAWGFFIGCVCTSFSLGYGYRFISLSESSDLLFNDIYFINRYIDAVFSPFDVSYLKHSGIIYRMRVLYHSILDLSASRNNLAIKLLNLNYKTDNKENRQAEKGEKEQEENNGTNNKNQQSADTKKEEKFSLLRHLLGIFNDFIKAEEIKWKKRLKIKDEKIKAANDTIEELKKDTISVDELIYFPAAAARIKELKTLIDERNKRLDELKGEVEGYYRNEKTYASLNQQIQYIYDRQAKLAENIADIESEENTKIKRVRDKYTKMQILIQEGYIIGKWFRNNSGKDAEETA